MIRSLHIKNLALISKLDVDFDGGLNVLSGERYKMVTKEFKALLKGEYGKLPAEPDKDVVAKIVGDEEIITCRPADLIEPEYEKFKEEMKEYYTQEEDVLSYALFNQVAINFFKYRLAKNKGVDKDLAENRNKVYPV